MRKKWRKIKKVRNLVPEAVVEKAATINPLAPKVEEPPTLEDIPRITNETITEHREEVLKGARKYIYPLQHSKHRIIVITVSISTAAIIAFLIYCTLGLYKFYQYNSFLYRVTQVVPFPIARAGNSFVDYENYLFELRHYVHYYQTQQQVNFGGADKQQLIRFRQQALTDVINNAYTKKLAQQNNVKVSNKEVNDLITEVRNQNRLGSNNKVFADVLRSYWGWSVSDFKRSLKDQMLSEKVAAALDKSANQKAQTVLAQIKAGADFGTVAKQMSEDPAAAGNGGDYGLAITKDNPNIPPQVINTLFSMQPGQVSGIILASPIKANSTPTLEIVKLLQKEGPTVTAQHISINLKSVSIYINELKTKQPAHSYVKF